MMMHGPASCKSAPNSVLPGATRISSLFAILRYSLSPPSWYAISPQNVRFEVGFIAVPTKHATLAAGICFTPAALTRSFICGSLLTWLARP